MVSRFSRSLRSVEKDGFRRSNAAIAVTFVMLLAWGAWFVLARVAVYEVSVRARVETDRAVHPIETSRGGRVTALHLDLGREVQAGEVLAELAAERERLELEEEQSRRETLSSEHAALILRVQALEDSLEEARRIAGVAEEEGAAELAERKLVADLAAREWEISRDLHAEGLLSDLRLLQAETEALKARSAWESAPATLERRRLELRREQSDRRATLAQTRGELRRIEGELRTAETRVERLRNELDEQLVRAPAAGEIGEVEAVAEGDYLQTGDRLGVVVSSGSWTVVGDFLPASALGRIRPGQAARLRLDGFPWSRHGVVDLEVLRVASEHREGYVRAEFRIVEPLPESIRMQHGLPGAIEVEVDRVRPAELVISMVASRRVDEGAIAPR